MKDRVGDVLVAVMAHPVRLAFGLACWVGGCLVLACVATRSLLELAEAEDALVGEREA